MYIDPILPYSGNVTSVKFNQLVYKGIKFGFQYDDEIMSFWLIEDGMNGRDLNVETLIIDEDKQIIDVNQTFIINVTVMSLPVQQVRLNC